MKILITGGAGFIGSNLANHLAKDNDVVVIDNEFLGTRKNLTDDVKFLKIGVEDKESLVKVFREGAFDYVYHMAAISSAPMYTDGKAPDPREWITVNIGGFVNVMQLSMENGVKKVIYASTSSIYSGNPLPFREDQVIRPKTFYETSVYARELIANSYRSMHDFKSVGLRYFAVYGYNEMHKGCYANLVSQFLWDMMDGKQPVIYGDGSQTRDFNFITDVTDANILAMKSGMDGVFNVGTGVAHDLNELVRLINLKLDTTIKPKYVENPVNNYVSATLADITNIAKFGYRPVVKLGEGIAKLIEYYKAQGNSGRTTK